MPSETYTPTTEDVKAALADWMWAQRTWRPELGQPDDAEIDRWLTAHDAAVEAAVRADQIKKDAAIAENFRKVYDPEFGLVMGDWDGWVAEEVPGWIAPAIRAQLTEGNTDE